MSSTAPVDRSPKKMLCAIVWLMWRRKTGLWRSGSNGAGLPAPKTMTGLRSRASSSVVMFHCQPEAGMALVRRGKMPPPPITTASKFSLMSSTREAVASWRNGLVVVTSKYAPSPHALNVCRTSSKSSWSP